MNEVTIMKCFRNAGILRHDFLVVQPMISAEIDPFVDIDDHDLSDLVDTTSSDELVELIHRVHGSEHACSLSELLAAESEIPICSEFAESTWDEEFMAEVGPQSMEVCQNSDDDEECDPDPLADEEPPPPSLKTLREVMDCLEDVRTFFELNNHTEEATIPEELVNKVAWLQCFTTKCTVQSKVTGYFQSDISED